MALRSCRGGRLPCFCMSLRGAKRRDNPFSLRQHTAKRHYSRRIRRSCKFALSIANLQSFPAGKRIATPVCALVRNDMQKTGTYSRVQGRPPPLSLRGAKRRDNPFSLRQHTAKRHYSRRIRRSCGFALSIANLQSFPAGMRIATPVCALVRNDMQKTGTYSRVQGRPPPLSLRGAKRRGNPFSLRQHMAKGNTLGEYGKVLRICPK